MEPLKFDLDLAELPVVLTRDGKPVKYLLRALDGSDRDAHLNDNTRRVKFHGDKALVNNFKGMQADLVSRSLFTVPDNVQLTIDEVQKFPSTVIEALYNKAREMSGLDDPATEAEWTELLDRMTAKKSTDEDVVRVRELINNLEDNEGNG